MWLILKVTMQNWALSCATFGSYAIVKYTKIIIFVSCGCDQVNKTCNLNESLGHHVKSSLHQRLPQKDALSLKEKAKTGSTYKYTPFLDFRENFHLQPFCSKYYKAFLTEISSACRYPYAPYFHS